MAEQKEAMKNLSLSDVFSDLFILGTHVKNSKELGYADSLRKRTIDMFASAERKGRDAGYAEELLTQAKYALAAFLDEMIMGSPWSDKEQWSVNPLQYEFFKESVAGVEFFNRLEAIRRASNLDSPGYLFNGHPPSGLSPISARQSFHYFFGSGQDHPVDVGRRNAEPTCCCFTGDPA